MAGLRDERLGLARQASRGSARIVPAWLGTAGVVRRDPDGTGKDRRGRSGVASHGADRTGIDWHGRLGAQWRRSTKRNLAGQFHGNAGKPLSDA